MSPLTVKFIRLIVHLGMIVGRHEQAAMKGATGSVVKQTTKGAAASAEGAAEEQEEEEENGIELSVWNAKTIELPGARASASKRAQVCVGLRNFANRSEPSTMTRRMGPFTMGF